MPPFSDHNALLTTQTARLLYHLYAKKMPVIDYRSRLSAADIAKDRRWSNITELYLAGNTTAQRLMRACGVNEHLITGQASDYEKFHAWCRCLPQLVGNPHVLWYQLALRETFGCDLPLTQESCDAIWLLTAERLAEPDFRARNLLAEAHVKLLCTADDPCDSLTHHAAIAADPQSSTRVLPTFCADRLFAVNRPGIAAYLAGLGDADRTDITDLPSLEAALRTALDRFAAHGCHSAQLTLPCPPAFVKPNPYHANESLKTALSTDGRGVNAEQTALICAQLMRFLGQEFVRRGWTAQLVFGAGTPASLADLFAYLETEDVLPPTLLCAQNPVDDAAMADLVLVHPRLRLGSTWRADAAPEALRQHIRILAAALPLGRWLGMPTEAGTPLAYPRQAYFRRILCACIGEWAESGLCSADMDTLVQLVCDICFNNAKNFFGFKLS